MMHKLLEKSMRFDGPETPPGGPVATPPTPAPAAEPPALAAPVTPPAAEPPAPAAPPAADDDPVRGLQAAAAAERKKRQAAETEAQALREQVAYLQGQHSVAPPAPTTEAPAGPPSPPVLEDYADFAAWQAADRQYIIDVATHNAHAAVAAERVAQRQQEASEVTARTFQERLSKAAELDPDLPEIASTFHMRGPNYIPLTAEMQTAILESDVGPKLLRYFADNKAEATRLAQLSPTTAMREMGRIEAQLIAQPKPVPPPVISQAPEPITTVSGSPLAGSTTELRDMPMGDYFKIRAPQIVKRR